MKSHWYGVLPGAGKNIFQIRRIGDFAPDVAVADPYRREINSKNDWARALISMLGETGMRWASDRHYFPFCHDAETRIFNVCLRRAEFDNDCRNKVLAEILKDPGISTGDQISIFSFDQSGRG